MLKIDQINNQPKQKHTLVLEDGTTVTIVLEYKPLQTGWFITSLVHGDFTLFNMRVVGSANMLHQYRNKLSFGLGCFVVGNQEPMLRDDFSSGRAKLCILTEAEVKLYAEILSGEAS